MKIIIKEFIKFSKNINFCLTTMKIVLIYINYAKKKFALKIKRKKGEYRIYLIIFTNKIMDNNMKVVKV